jgi:hypothetical protein
MRNRDVEIVDRLFCRAWRRLVDAAIAPLLAKPDPSRAIREVGEPA